MSEGVTILQNYWHTPVLIRAKDDLSPEICHISEPNLHPLSRMIALGQWPNSKVANL